MELITRPSNTSDMILGESSDELSSAAVINDTTNTCMLMLTTTITWSHQILSTPAE